VTGWNSLPFAFGPLLAVALVGLFALILRWAFSRGSSVVAAAPRVGNDGEYGLLVAVASPATHMEGEMLRLRLEGSGVRANLATTLEGPRVMVWPDDVAKAREVLANGR
jgi:hypothetical protein